MATPEAIEPQPPPDEPHNVPPASPEPYHPTPIPYSEPFENSIMNTILNPHGAFQPPSYVPTSASPPSIPLSELPLPLHDFRRVHPSPLQGILLPHPTYTLHGAPGPTEEQLVQLAQELVQKHSIRTEAQFLHWLDAEQAQQMRDLRERMRRRQLAIRENDSVMLEVRRLDMSRDMERRVADRWRSTRKTSGGSGGGRPNVGAASGVGGDAMEVDHQKEDGGMGSDSDSDIGAVMG